MMKLLLLASCLGICAFGRAQTLETYTLPISNVQLSQYNSYLGTVDVEYGYGGAGSLGAQLTLTASGDEGSGGLSASVSYVQNQYVVCTTAENASPPTTLYVLIGDCYAQETSTLSCDGNTGCISTVSASVGNVSNSSTTVTPPSIASSYEVYDDFNHYSTNGTGGATAGPVALSWNPVWTKLSSTQYKSSVCSIQSPSCAVALNLVYSTPYQASAKAIFDIPVTISVTP